MLIRKVPAFPMCSRRVSEDCEAAVDFQAEIINIVQTGPSPRNSQIEYEFPILLTPMGHVVCVGLQDSRGLGVAKEWFTTHYV